MIFKIKMRKCYENCITFADNLVNYLNDSGIDSEHRVDGSTIYLTIQ